MGQNTWRGGRVWLQAALLALGGLAAVPVLAHEPRLVAGAFNAAVGFRAEPAFAGEPNALDFILTDLNGNPLEIHAIHLEVKVLRLREDRFDAEVLLTKTLTDELRRDRNQPNRFNLWFLPQSAGAYGYLIEGEVNGIPVRERFVCRGGSQHAQGRSFGCVERLQSIGSRHRPWSWRWWR